MDRGDYARKKLDELINIANNKEIAQIAGLVDSLDEEISKLVLKMIAYGDYKRFSSSGDKEEDDNKFKIIIAGGRDFANYNLLKEKMDVLLQERKNIEIVSGTANGADTLGERYAREKKYNIKRFPADWDLYGKRAGYVRNKEMADYADACVVFWDGKSSGTKHMMDLATEKKIPLRLINY